MFFPVSYSIKYFFQKLIFLVDKIFHSTYVNLEPSNHLQSEPDESNPHGPILLVKIVLIPTSHIYLDLPSIKILL
jgi:hypothetical protein